jgi:antitoxin component YwqK of YwqJK toxin-antitoxin module
MKHLYIILLILPFLGFGQTQEEINKKLGELSNEINKNCPAVVDQYTTVLSTYGGFEMFMYHVQIDPDFFADYGMSQSEWLELQNQTMRTTFCTDPSMKSFRDLKIDVIWKYVDLSRRVIGKVKLNHLDCNKQSKRVHVNEVFFEDGRLKIELEESERIVLVKTKEDSTLLNGVYFDIYQNGQVKFEMKCKNGTPDGLWKYYNEEGQLQSEGIWKDGKNDGLWKYYNEEGQLTGENVYVDGNEMIRKHYHENGQLQTEINRTVTPSTVKNWDQNGVLISCKCFDKDRNEIECEE